ncbi:MAG: vancomycin high temperature exclusion protein [Candidatus Moraniibacteriota bacterium]
MISIARLHIIERSDGYIVNINDIEQIDYCSNVVVLGAKVYDDGRMSLMLKERAMAAIDLYENNKVCKLIISGIDDEVYAVQKYLIENNIPKDIIYIDEGGVDTFTSMKNMHDIYKLENAVIVTQEFHLPRSVYIARTLDIDAIGFVAYKYPYQNKFEEYKYIIREWLAGLKAIGQVEINTLQ